jgi:uncharacterized glyoxalase superfamily protein PhnB
MTTLTPYLLFDGKCQPAMEFYKSCFGGALTLTKVRTLQSRITCRQSSRTKSSTHASAEASLRFRRRIGSGLIGLRSGTTRFVSI